jgi:uncharacterized protein DUF3237
MSRLPQPELTYFCTLEVDLSPPLELGRGRAGTKRIIPIRGGRVYGPKINGKILDTGADWQTLLADGVAQIDARYAFELEDGAIIELRNFGFRHGPKEVLDKLAAGEVCAPESYYMRTGAYLETGHPRYEWVNKTMFIGTGAKREKNVQLDLYAIR